MKNADLRETLFDVITGLKNGTIDEKRANAISNTASVIIQSAKLDLECGKYMKKMNDADFFLTPEQQQAVEERVQIELKKRLPENAKYFPELKQA